MLRRYQSVLLLSLLLVPAFPVLAGPQPPPTNILYGFLNSNRTLTYAPPGPVYYVVGDYIVNAGVTLTVEPGVSVVFSANRDTLGGGGFPTKAELIVNGAFVADASSGDSIRFYSTENGTGDWGRISLAGPGPHILRRMSVSGAVAGIYCGGNGSLTMTNALVGNVGASGAALYANGPTTVANLVIVNTGGGNGVQLDGTGMASDMVISGFDMGMYLGGSVAASRIAVTGCKNGVYAYSYSGSSLRQCTIVGTGKSAGGTGLRKLPHSRDSMELDSPEAIGRVHEEVAI